ncbi:MAG: HindVP family restriction endonuclease [Deltaproteobacteria bacterium]|nr:HindVP family restriction endonuclease [Deltaproteobacteria bacterium]
MAKPALYGITHSNRDFSDPYYWGKNQFNSAFPVALACFMRDSHIKPVYLRLDKQRKIFHEEISVGDLFNTKLENDKLFFAFESRFEPYTKFVHDELETIDLVLKDARSNQFMRPLEIKLTTLPDNTTASLHENKYGCEIVIRSPTMRYMALSMADSLQKKFKEIRDIFEPTCLTIRQWDNEVEIRNNMPKILDALEAFNSKYRKYEKPLLIQPVWKTIGKSTVLADNCLDIFVWSDFALTRLFMDSALENESETISRQQRAAARLARFFFEISRAGMVYQKPIYDGMSLGNQTDKEFAISGNKTYTYMKCDRLTKPIIQKNQVKKIILGGGQKFLSPERRFDAIIFFSNDLFD